MRGPIRLTAAAVLGVAGLAYPAAAQGPSFSKDIVPIFKTRCIRCHNQKQPQGGLSLSTFGALEKGGKGGKVLGAKADESRLVKFILGVLKPQMPIGESMPKPEIDKVVAWVNAGAKADVDPNTVVIPDSAIPVPKVPVIKLRVPMLPQVGALAWSADGKILAVGTYRVVKLFNPETGELIRELPGHGDVVHDLEFSADGTLLAAAGGPPSQQGEIKIWNVATGQNTLTIVGHNDYIYSCAWSPDGKMLASASYDKLVKLWDTSNGNELKTLKDHADAVYGVAFHPEGKLLASGSADRSVKVWDVATGKRIYTLSGHGDIVFSIAWNKAGNQITSTGADRSMRTWNVNPQGGNQARNVGAGDKSVSSVVYSQDGNLLATAGEDRTIRVWNAGNGGSVQVVKDQTDAMLSVALSPDGKLVAGGGYDGTVRIYNVADGKLVRTIIDVPKPPEPKPVVDPKAKPADPKAKPADPKAKPADPKAKPVDPKAKPADPKAKPADAKAKPAGPKAKPADLKAAP